MSNFITTTKFYLNEHELRKLDTAARKLGLSRSAYVRHLLRTVLPIPFPKDDLSGLLEEPQQHAEAINQIAVQIDATAVFDLPALQTQMERLQDPTERFLRLFTERKVLIEESYSKRIHKPHGKGREVTIHITEADKHLLNRSAKDARITQSAYLSFLIYGIRPTEKASPEFFAVMRELDNIGISLSSIWLRAKRYENPDVETYERFIQWQQNMVSTMIHLV